MDQKCFVNDSIYEIRKKKFFHFSILKKVCDLTCPLYLCSLTLFYPSIVSIKQYFHTYKHFLKNLYFDVHLKIYIENYTVVTHKLTINFEASSERTQLLHQYLEAGNELELLRHYVDGGRVVCLFFRRTVSRRLLFLIHFHF